MKPLCNDRLHTTDFIDLSIWGPYYVMLLLVCTMLFIAWITFQFKISIQICNILVNLSLYQLSPYSVNIQSVITDHYQIHRSIDGSRGISIGTSVCYEIISLTLLWRSVETHFQQQQQQQQQQHDKISVLHLLSNIFSLTWL